MRRLISALLLVIIPVSASAMTVAEFLAKAKSLEEKGMAAMFSPDINLLKAEVQSAGVSYRADVAKARAQGRTDLGCPPMQGKFGVKSNEIITEFSAIPPAQRSTTTVRSAFSAMMKKRFVCR